MGMFTHPTLIHRESPQWGFCKALWVDEFLPYMEIMGVFLTPAWIIPKAFFVWSKQLPGFFCSNSDRKLGWYGCQNDSDSCKNDVNISSWFLWLLWILHNVCDHLNIGASSYSPASCLSSCVRPPTPATSAFRPWPPSMFVPWNAPKDHAWGTRKFGTKAVWSDCEDAGATIDAIGYRFNPHQLSHGPSFWQHQA